MAAAMQIAWHMLSEPDIPLDLPDTANGRLEWQPTDTLSSLKQITRSLVSAPGVRTRPSESSV